MNFAALDMFGDLECATHNLASKRDNHVHNMNSP
jgi:hypothetical protein